MDTSDLKNVIGSKIYDIRMDNELTQEQFANKLSIYTSRGYISKIESASIMPSAEFIRDVCTTFNISPYNLLNINEFHDLSLSNKEKNILNLFNNLSVESKNTVFTLLKLLQGK